MIIKLHPYQQDVKNKIYHEWNSGAKNVLGVMPTGSGKSVLTSDIILDGSKLGMQQVVIAHRNELVSQMSMHIAERGIKHKIIGPNSTVAQIIRQHREKFNGQSFINPTSNTSVAGVDTIISRQNDLMSWGFQQDRWVIDEAHHCIGNERVSPNKWGKAVQMFKNAHGLGVTATPTRADGQGLGADYDGVFHKMVLGPNMRELINMGNLTDYEIVCPESDLRLDDKDIGESGDYSRKKLHDAAQKSHIVGDVVSNYCKYAFGKQAICFATDVETAGEIAKNFNAVGIRAASLSAQTPTNIREYYIREFRNGQLMILVNVDLFGEGFDCPACEVVIMARPTASLGLYLQMIGRALRVFAGKLYGLIIDHVSNWLRHGLPDKFHNWTLARRDKRGKQEKDPEEIALTVCRACTRPYERFHLCCPYCGAIPPLPSVRERTVEMVEGNLVLLDRAKLEQMRQKTILPSAGDVALKVSAAAGSAAGHSQGMRQVEKIAAQKRLSDAIGIWAAIQREKGRSDQESYKRFYLTLGIDVLGALSVERSRQDYEELANKVEGWYK